MELKGKRLFVVNTTGGRVATGFVMSSISKAAREAGMEVEINYGREDNSLFATSEAKNLGIECRYVGNKKDLLIDGLKTRFFGGHGRYSENVTLKIINNIKRFYPDIINLHNIHGYYLNYELLFDFLKHTKIPVVWTLHDCWSFTGQCPHFSPYKCNKWLTGCSAPCKAIHDYPRCFTDRGVERNYNLKKENFRGMHDMTLVGVCEWMSDTVAHSFLGDYNRVVIKNGIDLNFFKPRYLLNEYELRDDTDFGFKTGKPVMLAIAGKWSQTKGLNDFLKISDILADDVQPVIVGNLPRNVALKENVRNIPFISPLELASLYRKGSVLVNPTYADTFPTVNLEAMAAGVPVAAYNTGGISEAITPETGIVTEVGDVESLAAGVKDIIKSGGEIGRMCRRRMEQDYDIRRMQQQYINLFKDILEKRGVE